MGSVARQVFSSSRQRAALNRAYVIDVAVALGAELHTGAGPEVALGRVAAELPGLVDRAAAQAGLGGRVADELTRAGTAPGADGLRLLAAAWSVAQLTGAGLAPACDRTVRVLREDAAVQREVSTQLAGSRATARLMAGLPVVGIGLGMTMGAQPLNVLLRTPYGIACLVIGGTLAAAGLIWTERLARAVERMR